VRDGIVEIIPEIGDLSPTSDSVSEELQKHYVWILKGYLNDRPQISMVYRLINHAGCWENTRRICKSRAAEEKGKERHKKGKIKATPAACMIDVVLDQMVLEIRFT